MFFDLSLFTCSFGRKWKYTNLTKQIMFTLQPNAPQPTTVLQPLANASATVIPTLVTTAGDKTAADSTKSSTPNVSCCRKNSSWINIGCVWRSKKQHWNYLLVVMLCDGNKWSRPITMSDSWVCNRWSWTAVKWRGSGCNKA